MLQVADPETRTKLLDLISDIHSPGHKAYTQDVQAQNSAKLAAMSEESYVVEEGVGGFTLKTSDQTLRN